jgi:hypothetical protein
MEKTFGEQLRQMEAKVQETFEIAKSIVATGQGRNTLKLVLVGGDDRALRGPWPPWYDVVHFDRHTTTQRARQVLSSGTVDAIVIFTKWKKNDLTHVVRQTAKCPIYYWPTNPDQLARNLGQFIEKKQRAEAPMAAPPSELLMAGQKLPLPAPAVEEDADDEDDDDAPFEAIEGQHHEFDGGTTHFVGDGCPTPLPAIPQAAVAQLSPDKQAAMQRSAELLSTINRRDSWNLDEWQMLLISLEEAGSDGKKFIRTMKTLGCKRTVAAMIFAIDRASKQLNLTIDAEMLRQVRKVGRRQWKKAQQKKKLEEQALLAKATDVLAAAPPAVQEAIMHAGAEIAAAPTGDERFRKTVDFIVLGVEIGRLSKEQGFDEIVKLLGR